MAALVSTFAVFAREQKVRDVDIEVTLFKTGEALIHEKWDVNTGDEITEWYLPRENLGDIGIAAFKVYSDGKELSDDGEWDVDRSRSQKAGRFGIVHKRSGVELCWGIGDYGDHVFEPVYLMTNVVKTLDDYDMIHMQFVTDELAAAPQHVRVTIKAADELGVQLDTNTTRAWGFGYSGTVSFENGTVVFESDEPFRYKSSVISLLRFNKGIFESPSVQEREFSDVLSLAMSGADFGDGNSDEDEDTPGDIAAFFTMLAMYLAGRKLVRKAFVLPANAFRIQLVEMLRDLVEESLHCAFLSQWINWTHYTFLRDKIQEYSCAQKSRFSSLTKRQKRRYNFGVQKCLTGRSRKETD